MQKNFIKCKDTIIFTPFPKKVSQLIYIDYDVPGEDDGCIAPALKKIPGLIAMEYYREEDKYPGCAIVFLKMYKSAYDTVVGLIQNLDTKVEVLYGQEAAKTYKEGESRFCDLLIKELSTHE